MWEKIVYIIIFMIIALIGFFHFRNQQNKKELITYLAMMLINGLLLLAHCLEMELPSPLDFITFIYQPISDIVFGFINLAKGRL